MYFFGTPNCKEIFDILDDNNLEKITNDLISSYYPEDLEFFFTEAAYRSNIDILVKLLELNVDYPLNKKKLSEEVITYFKDLMLIVKLYYNSILR